MQDANLAAFGGLPTSSHASGRREGDNDVASCTPPIVTTQHHVCVSVFVYGRVVVSLGSLILLPLLYRGWPEVGWLGPASGAAPRAGRVRELAVHADECGMVQVQVHVHAPPPFPGPARALSDALAATAACL